LAAIVSGSTAVLIPSFDPDTSRFTAGALSRHNRHV